MFRGKAFIEPSAGWIVCSPGAPHRELPERTANISTLEHVGQHRVKVKVHVQPAVDPSESSTPPSPVTKVNPAPRRSLRSTPLPRRRKWWNRRGEPTGVNLDRSVSQKCGHGGRRDGRVPSRIGSWRVQPHVATEGSSARAQLRTDPEVSPPLRDVRPPRPGHL